MTSASKPVLTGGCQCGAVRFAVSAPPTKISVCHCRMCQKASGAPFASFADIDQHVAVVVYAVARLLLARIDRCRIDPRVVPFFAVVLAVVVGSTARLG